MPHGSRINFDELKARADFRVVLSHYGLTPVGQGEQLKIRCPFHADERPSCSVNLEKKLFHCFGCDLSGNVLDFVHRMETKDGAAVSLRQAGWKLAEICGVTSAAATAMESGARMREGGPGRPEQKPGPSPLPREKATRTRQEPRSASSAVETAFPSSEDHNGVPGRSARARVASQHEARAARNKPLGFTLSLDPAHPYLSERGLSPELIELFGLGFFAGEKGVMLGRVCIPIHNAAGELVAYAGRWPGEPPKGTERWILPPGFHKALELFNLHRVKHCKHLVVVEGFFDAIRLHSLRLPAVALMGTSISEEQVALLSAYCPALRFVTVMLDGDDAGQKAGDIVGTVLAKHWFTRIVALPIGSQPDTVESSVLRQVLVLGKAPVQG